MTPDRMCGDLCRAFPSFARKFRQYLRDDPTKIVALYDRTLGA